MFKKVFLLMSAVLLSTFTACQNTSKGDGVASIHTYGAENITINYDKETYYVGDTVKFSVVPSEGIEIISVSANYKTLELKDGFYSFVAKITNSIKFVTKTKEGEKTIDVILLSGQSNMEGNTNSTGLLTTSAGFTEEEIESIKAGYDGIPINYISYYKGAPNNRNESMGFTRTQLGQGNPSGNKRFGPEIGIAETLHNNGYDDKVALIKCAVGASFLAPQANEWMGNSAPYYYEFINLIDESLSLLEDEGYKPVIKAFCWMQGEADAGNSSYTSNYAKNLGTFVEQFKDRYEAYQEGDFQFIDAYISTSSVWAYASQMNAQKQTFADTHDWATAINTNAAGLQVGAPGGDQYHYNVYSEYKLGLLFGEEILKAL